MAPLEVLIVLYGRSPVRHLVLRRQHCLSPDSVQRLHIPISTVVFNEARSKILFDRKCFLKLVLVKPPGKTDSG